MPPGPRAQCQICSQNESKYTCSGCRIVYCSVSCYKEHKGSSCHGRPEQADSTNSSKIAIEQDRPEDVTSSAPVLQEGQGLSEPKSLRPLTSLNWPYVPEASAYPDPLKRDDPKPLQTHHYEAIATSPAIRKALAAHPRLPTLLTSIDKLRGPDREQALQRALGVTVPDIIAQGNMNAPQQDEDVLALRELAEAVETAVRGTKQDTLGLDWGE